MRDRIARQRRRTKRRYDKLKTGTSGASWIRRRRRAKSLGSDDPAMAGAWRKP